MKKMLTIWGLLSLLVLLGVFTITGATPSPVSAATVQSNMAQAASSCPPTISRGSTGSAVRLLQSDLYSRTPGGLTVDGIFGSQTEKAVENWQRALGLKVDGIVGPKTWATLGECN
ncbi:peptidoglycan-binding domain-containing protein [Ktedonobacter robiniae]|uniref:Peptidoglycan binding-like domain-containing protein n=1 Tax=Ktedonobacter robiniae TaxID=2778365 RepID=A0ABQ3UU68_9CHLR|nr:peptidoglycan-binding domain-containing protein [Ktedonobacter robiniae]GHO56361.1 hypothetical protein KSB_48360 [Ktedonobacter robiniae]